MAVLDVAGLALVAVGVGLWVAGWIDGTVVAGLGLLLGGLAVLVWSWCAGRATPGVHRRRR